MPIYEFFCPNNNKIYSFLARSLAYSEAEPKCPDNPKFRMERMISSFAVTGKAKADEDHAQSAENDPNFDAALAHMQREFGSLDADNPDPKQVARLFRSMTGISGEKMPEQMEEMVRRLESGERLDDLEEKFGDMEDAIDPEPGQSSAEFQKIRERLRAARRRPVRDPVLYDMGDYAELPRSAPSKTRDRRGRAR